MDIFSFSYSYNGAKRKPLNPPCVYSFVYLFIIDSKVREELFTSTPLSVWFHAQVYGKVSPSL